jgi:hypothetical protein
MGPSYHQDILPTLGDFIESEVLDSVVKLLPSSQIKRGDKKLERAREIVNEFRSVTSESDRVILEERIIL